MSATEMTRATEIKNPTGAQGQQPSKPSDGASFADVLTSFAAGGIAGATAKTSIAPLDRCKIYFQISNEPYSSRAALQYVRQVYREQGGWALWRGNSATMARILPYAAIQFSSHEQYKRLLGVHNIKPGDSVRHIEVKRFLAGSLAGVTSQSLTYPLDLARARMAVTHDSQYASLKLVFERTYRKEGLKGFFRGYLPTVLGVVPYAGASFCTYETLKYYYEVYRPGQKPSTVERLAFGALSGITGQTVSYPLDIVRRRMQTAVITGRHYKNITNALTTILREEGFLKGYFKGLSMNWVKGPIATGISFATYDLVKDLLTELHTARRSR